MGIIFELLIKMMAFENAILSLLDLVRVTWFLLEDSGILFVSIFSWSVEPFLEI